MGGTPSWSKTITCHSMRRKRLSKRARSIHSPSKSGSPRRTNEALMAKAPISAVTESACENPVCTGGPSGNPVMWTTPLRASPTLPNPGSLRAVVVAPLPVIWSITALGLSRWIPSQSRPHFANVLNRMLVMTTSAHWTSSWASAWPAGKRRSRVTDRLLRPDTFHQRCTPSLVGPWLRPGSPALGSSTCTTSAPRSASSVPASGPAITCANSTTLTPARAGRDFVSAVICPPFTPPPLPSVPRQGELLQADLTTTLDQGLDVGEAVVRDELVPHLQGGAQLSAGQVQPEAAVGPEPEPDVAVATSVEVDLVRVVHLRRASVGRRKGQHHHVAFFHRTAVEVDVAGDLPARQDNGVGSEKFLDGRRDDGRVRADPMPCVSVAGEVVEHEAQLAGRRLEPGHDQYLADVQD